MPAPRYTSAIKMRFLLNIDATDRQVPSMIPSITYSSTKRVFFILSRLCYAQQYEFYEVTDLQASPPTSSHYRSHQHLILPLISIANAFQCFSRSRTLPRASKDNLNFCLLPQALHTSNYRRPNQRHLACSSPPPYIFLFKKAYPTTMNCEFQYPFHHTPASTTDSVNYSPGDQTIGDQTTQPPSSRLAGAGQGATEDDLASSA